MCLYESWIRRLWNHWMECFQKKKKISSIWWFSTQNDQKLNWILSSFSPNEIGPMNWNLLCFITISFLCVFIQEYFQSKSIQIVQVQKSAKNSWSFQFCEINFKMSNQHIFEIIPIYFYNQEELKVTMICKWETNSCATQLRVSCLRSHLEIPELHGF